MKVKFQFSSLEFRPVESIVYECDKYLPRHTSDIQGFLVFTSKGLWVAEETNGPEDSIEGISQFMNHWSVVCIFTVDCLLHSWNLTHKHSN